MEQIRKAWNASNLYSMLTKKKYIYIYRYIYTESEEDNAQCKYLGRSICTYQESSLGPLYIGK